MIDWNFIYDGMKSIDWLKTCNDLPKEYGKEAFSKKIGEIWKKTYQPVDRRHRLLNPTVLMMAAYIYFVYPKERIDEIDFTNISIENFKVVEKKNNHDKDALIRRLRNSIAHANYKIENGEITFIDQNSGNGSNRIVFQIGIENFGIFIDQFRSEVYKQKININQ